MLSKKTKRFMSVLLTLALVFSFFPSTGFVYGQEILNTGVNEKYSEFKELGLTDTKALDSLSDNQLEALEAIVSSPRSEGLIGFEGEDMSALLEDDPVTVIVEFNNQPADIAAAYERFSSNKYMDSLFDLDEAQALANADQEEFREGLLHLFPSKTRSVNSLYNIDFTYTQGMNGVSITLPGNKVVELLNIDSVLAIYPNITFQLNTIDRADIIDTDEASPLGMLESREMLNIEALHDAGIKGEGVVVGVIDTGVDYNHPDFQGAFLTEVPEGSDGELLNGYFYGRSLVTGRPSNDPMEVTYDDWLASGKAETNSSGNNYYTDHGTHVSGSIVGRGTNEGYATLGIAPEAKLIVYSTASAYSTLASNSIIGALDKVAMDGCDVVNMSLGANTNDPNYITSLIVNNLSLTYDILFCVSAGNSGPGAATATAPATSSLALTVGASTIPISDFSLTIAVNDNEYNLHTRLQNFSTTLESNENGTYKFVDSELDINEFEDNQYKLVIVPALGSDDPLEPGLANKEDFTDELVEQLKGNIAVIKRGNKFSQVAENAKAAGAFAVLLINTENGDDLSQIYNGKSPDWINIYHTTYEDGKKLLTDLSESDYLFKVTNAEDKQDAGNPTYFSSKGPVDATYDIKPDIIAPGLGILSTAPISISNPLKDPEIGYTTAVQPMSGTSMASPCMTGVAALLRGYDPDWSAIEVKARIMNNADKTPSEQSVYEVGAGFVNPCKAIYAENYITVDYDMVSVPKPGTTTFDKYVSSELSTFNFGGGIGKITTKTLTGKVNGEAGKTFAISHYFNTVSYFDRQQVDIKNSDYVTILHEDTVTSGSGFEVTLKISENLNRKVDSGSYEGYVVLTNVDDENEIYKIPFAYYLIPSLLNSFYFNTPVLSLSPDRQLGYMLASDRTYDASGNSDIYVNVNRSIYYLDLVVAKKDRPDVYLGEISSITFNLLGILEVIKPNTNHRANSYMYGSYRPYVPGTTTKVPAAEAIPFEDGADYVVIPKIYINSSAFIYEDPVDVYFDSVAPVITITEKNLSTSIIKGNIFDEGLAEMYDLGIKFNYDKENPEATQDKNALYAGVNVDGNVVYTAAEIDKEGNFTLDLSDVGTPITEDTVITLYGIDHFTEFEKATSALPASASLVTKYPNALSAGFNPDGYSFRKIIGGNNTVWIGKNMVRKVITLTSEAELAFVSDKLAIDTFDELNVTPIFNEIAIKSGDTIKSITSSDTDVVTVDEQGNLYAVSKGTATITAISKFGLIAACEITVSDVSPASIKINSPAITIVSKNQSLQLSVIFNPTNVTCKDITWTSSNKAIVEIDETGTVKLNSTGSVVVTATSADGKVKNSISLKVNK